MRNPFRARQMISLGVFLAATVVVGQTPQIPTLQVPAYTPPPLAEVEATWRAYWACISRGDLPCAVQYVHSSLRTTPAEHRPVSVMKEAAEQMAFCRIVPTPTPLGPDAAMYPVHCEHGEETAELFIEIRKDRDGVWRLLP